MATQQAKMRIRDEIKASTDQVWTFMSFEATLKKVLRKVFEMEIKNALFKGKENV